MKLCPNVIMPVSGRGNDPSSAEMRVFNLLKNVDLGRQWTAYHSLNCSEHQYKKWSEIDFLLVGPDGVVVLEVKGGRIQREVGVWYYVDRWDRRHKNTEGPFVQAKTAMYALKNSIAGRGGIDKDLLGRWLFGWGVVFPDVDWQEDGPENPREIVASRSATASTRHFERYIRGLISYWEGKSRAITPIDDSELKALGRTLRPNIDLYPPLTLSIGHTMEEMQALTDEQYERVEVIEENDRVIVTGGAGTGKTHLMIQCARREAESGKTVLIVVHSTVLAAWLDKSICHRNVTVRAYDNLPRPPKPQDVLMVDEGQDLLDMGVFDTLAEHLNGSLDVGRWRWFMDSQNQTGISGWHDPDALDFLLNGLTSGPPVRLPLKMNVRNTHEVIDCTRMWTGKDIGRSKLKGHGRLATLAVFHDRLELATKVSKLLDELIDDEHALIDDIGVVLSMGDDGAILRNLTKRHRRKLAKLDSTSVRADLRGKLVWGNVQHFKGMERAIILAVGFDDTSICRERLSELYVTMTRANYGLYFFAAPDLAFELLDRSETGSIDAHER